MNTWFWFIYILSYFSFICIKLRLSWFGIINSVIWRSICSINSSLFDFLSIILILLRERFNIFFVVLFLSLIFCISSSISCLILCVSCNILCDRFSLFLFFWLCFIFYFNRPLVSIFWYFGNILKLIISFRDMCITCFMINVFKSFFFFFFFYFFWLNGGWFCFIFSWISSISGVTSFIFSSLFDFLGDILIFLR